MLEQATNRRSFLKTATLATAGAAVTPWTARSYAQIAGANDRVRTGIVGCGDRMKQALVPAFMSNCKDMNFQFVAVSDIWNMRRNQGAEMLTKKTGNQVDAVRNNEELYARKDIDAVLIATADFQHAQHGIEAVNAGRDAYVEKPTAHTMEDARNFRAAVHKTGKIVQVGTQRRSTPSYQRAYEYIKSGQFGDIVMVEMTWNVNQPGRWRRQDVVPLLKEEDTDWNRYQLNLPRAPFDARKYLEFRLFWPYSSGLPDQWLVHQIDTVHWFTGLPHPRSVVANGGIYAWRDGRTNWDTLTAVFDYGPLDDMSKGFQVSYSTRQTNEAGGVKELYYSTGGMLDMDKQQVTPTGGLTAKYAAEMKMEPKLLKPFSLSDGGKTSAMATDANTGAGDPQTNANMRNWMECVRSRKTPNASIEAGYSHSVALCMCIAAMQSGQRVTFDEKSQSILAGASMSKLHVAAGALALAALAISAAAQVQVKRDDANRKVDVTIDGSPFTSYVWPTSLKKPVLFPLITSNGVTVTRGYPLAPRDKERVDHPHHAGMWFNYGNVNGFDFWNNSDAIPEAQRSKMGSIRQERIVSTKSGKDRGELTVDSLWTTGAGEDLLKQTTRYVFSKRGDMRFIDQIVTLTALDRAVFKDDKEGLLGMRVAHFLESPTEKGGTFMDSTGRPTKVDDADTAGATGVYRTSEGVEGDKVWSTRGAWCTLTGTAGGKTVTVAMLDNKKNPGYPTYWHARGYGLFAANPLGDHIFNPKVPEHDFTLEKGASTTFTYRIILFPRATGTEELNQASMAFESEYH